jgi:hypothetical protein
MNAQITRLTTKTILKLSKLPEWNKHQFFSYTILNDKILIDFEKNTFPIKKTKSHLILEIPKKNTKSVDNLEHKIFCYDENNILINIFPQIPNTTIQLNRKLETHDIEILKKQIIG